MLPPLLITLVYKKFYPKNKTVNLLQKFLGKGNLKVKYKMDDDVKNVKKINPSYDITSIILSSKGDYVYESTRMGGVWVWHKGKEGSAEIKDEKIFVRWGPGLEKVYKKRARLVLKGKGIIRRCACDYGDRKLRGWPWRNKRQRHPLENSVSCHDLNVNWQKEVLQKSKLSELNCVNGY